MKNLNFDVETLHKGQDIDKSLYIFLQEGFDCQKKYMQISKCRFPPTIFRKRKKKLLMLIIKIDYVHFACR